jgi:hypothetical protein
MPDIRDTWKLDRGDMLYGIGPEITDYLKRLYGSGINAHAYKEERYAAINTYNTSLKSSLFAVHGTTVAVTAPSSTNRWKSDYATKLNAKAKYAPSTVGGDLSADAGLLASLKKGRSTLATTSSTADIAAAAKELAIRRSCKFGIEYAITLPAYIHYILDGMDMKKVANKELFDKTITIGSGSGARSISFKKMSICTSELRFLFRNWQRIKATNRVLFYWKYKTTPAPWEDDVGYPESMVLWADYAHHRVEKAVAKALKPLDDQLTNDLSDFAIAELLADQDVQRKAIELPFAAFRKARKEGKPAVTQVAAFHAISSALVNS